MADRSPFERIFNVDNPEATPFGAMLGTVGQIAGNKTTGEIAQDAQAKALSQMSSEVSAGATPQQALLNFLKSPQGQEAFSKGMTVDIANRFMQAVNPTPTVGAVGPGQTPVITRPGQAGVEFGQQTPTTEQATARTIAPTLQVGPGNSLAQQPQGGYGYQTGPAAPTTEESTSRTIAPTVGVGPGTTLAQQPKGGYGYTPGFNNKPTEAQNFDNLKQYAQLPPNVLADIAKVNMLPPDQRDSELKRLTDAAVQNGSMAQEVADKLRTGYYGGQGVIRMIPKLNRVGEEIGTTILDMGANNGRGASMDVYNQGLNAPGAPPATPGSPAAAVQSTSGPQPRTNKALMFFGTGLPANVLAPLGQMVRGTLGVDIPLPGSEDATNNIRNLGALQTSLVQMAKEGAGLSVPGRVIAAAQSMGPEASTWSDPKTAVAHAIDLHAQLTEQMGIDTQRLNDIQVSKEEKHAAEKRIVAYQHILSQLPSLPEMTSLQKDMQEGGPVTRANEVSVGNVGRAAVQAVTSGSKKVGPAVDQTLGGPPGEQPTSAGGDRFSKLSNQSFLGIDPKKLAPQDLGNYYQEVQRRQSLSQRKKQGAAK